MLEVQKIGVEDLVVEVNLRRRQRQLEAVRQRNPYAKVLQGIRRSKVQKLKIEDFTVDLQAQTMNLRCLQVQFRIVQRL